MLMSRVVEVTGLMVGFVGSVWSKTDGSISGKLLACRRVRPSSARVQLRREEEDEYDPLLADIASLKKRRALEKEKERNERGEKMEKGFREDEEGNGGGKKVDVEGDVLVRAKLVNRCLLMVFPPVPCGVDALSKTTYAAKGSFVSIISNLFLYNFFAVMFFLAWLAVGAILHFTVKSEVLLDP